MSQTPSPPSTPRAPSTSDGRTLTPVQVAAHEGIQRRLTRPSMHWWGVEGVHPDAWLHIAMAAADGTVKYYDSRERAEGRASESHGDKIVRRIAARTIPAGEWEEVPRG
jgi:hypothetical protein